jgi:hypothetical protein
MANTLDSENHHAHPISKTSLPASDLARTAQQRRDSVRLGPVGGWKLANPTLHGTLGEKPAAKKVYQVRAVLRQNMADQSQRATHQPYTRLI